jgi:polysaccharide export outer membrane protein
MNYFMCRKKLPIMLVIVVAFATACSSTKNVPYFQDMISSSDSNLMLPTFEEPLIQQDDILNIAIYTTDPTTSMVVNQLMYQNATSTSINQQTTQPTNGMLVDKAGFVDIPIVGKIQVANLTTSIAKEKILAIASKVYQDPTVQVRFTNFKITILGEVARPASYVVPNEKVTILDALGLAGDLTIFGKRENVLVIREDQGKKIYSRLNLNSSDLFKSHFFYLKQNDVLYVEPNKGKAASLNQARTQTFAIIGSALSVLVVLFSRN